MSVRRGSWLLVAAAAAGGIGCGDDGGVARSHEIVVTARDLSRERPVLRGPKEAPAGRVRIVLRNEGRILHDAQLFRVAPGHPVSDLAKAAVEVPDSYPRPRWVRVAGGVAATRPGTAAAVVQVLEPGTYVFADTQERDEGPQGPKVSNARKGGTLTLRVTEGGSGALPETAARIVATDDGFEVTGLRAGVNRVTFENRGEEPHQAVLYPMRAGGSPRRVLARVGVGWSPVAVPASRATAVMEAGERQVTSMTLRPGRYLVVCHAADRAGGSPHFFDGGVETVDVR
jgi:hypothetical protein